MNSMRIDVKSIYNRDWRKLDTYKDMEDISLEQWAWEFLRRNPEYIQEWNNLTNGLTDEEKKDFSTLLEKIPYDAGKKWGISFMYNPDLSISYIDFLPLEPLAGRRVSIVITGLQDYQKMLRVLGYSDYKVYKDAILFGLSTNFETGDVLFSFNVNQPISPQIKRVIKILKKLQEKSKEKGNKVRKAFKPRKDEWIELIRILDAKAMGVKDKEIASVLFPNERSLDIYAPLKKINDKYNQAIRYVKHDYRLIPYSEK